MLTRLVDIVFVLTRFSLEWYVPLLHESEAFAEDDELVPRDVVLLNRLSDDLFGDTIGVDVGSVPLWDDQPLNLQYVDCV